MCHVAVSYLDTKTSSMIWMCYLTETACWCRGWENCAIYYAPQADDSLRWQDCTQHQWQPHQAVAGCLWSCQVLEAHGGSRHQSPESLWLLRVWGSWRCDKSAQSIAEFVHWRPGRETQSPFPYPFPPTFLPLLSLPSPSHHTQNHPSPTTGDLDTLVVMAFKLWSIHTLEIFDFTLLKGNLLAQDMRCAHSALIAERQRYV